jgi:hypothetical protein
MLWWRHCVKISPHTILLPLILSFMICAHSFPDLRLLKQNCRKYERQQLLQPQAGQPPHICLLRAIRSLQMLDSAKLDFKLLLQSSCSETRSASLSMTFLKRCSIPRQITSRGRLKVFRKLWIVSR